MNYREFALHNVREFLSKIMGIDTSHLSDDEIVDRLAEAFTRK